MGILDPGTPTRNRTYGIGTPVDPNDLNDLQDSVIARRQARWVYFAFGKAPLETNITFDAGGGVYPGQIKANAAAAFYKGGIVHGIAFEGAKVSGLRADVTGTGGAQNVVLRLMCNGVMIGQLVVANPAAGRATYTLDPIASVTTIGAGQHLTIEADLPLNTTIVHDFAVKVALP